MHPATIPLLMTSLVIIPSAFGQVAGAGDSAEAAQPVNLPAVSRGARVRVTAPSLSLEGEITTLGGLRGDTLILGPARFGQPVRAVPLSAVTRFEVSAGRKSHAKLGATLGALAGLVVGVALAPLPEKRTCDLEQEGLDCLAPDFGDASGDLVAALGVVVVGTLAGAGVGALVGSAFGTERWTVIEDPDVGLGLTVNGGGPGLAISSRW